MRGQRVAPRPAGMYTHGEDSDSSAEEPESGSASTAGNDGGDDGSNGAVASQRAGRSAGSSEGAAEEDPSYGEDPGSGGTVGSPQELSLVDIQSCFSLGLREAANKLGVCATTLKRHCRKHGISKWPNRELKKYQRAMAEIQRLRSDAGATLPLPPAMAAVAAAPASGRNTQQRSQPSDRPQVSDGSPARATAPRNAAPAARRQRTNRRQAKGPPAEAAAPASPASTRTHSDRTAGRRQPPTPEISDAPSMLGAAAAWTASDSTTPSLTAVKTGQVVEGQQQLVTPGGQHSVTHHEPQQWPPPLLPGPLEHPGGSGSGAHGAADEHLQLLGLHRQQAAVAVQHAARAQGQWSGMQLAQELAQYQQALPQGGLAAGGGLSAWPPELQPGAQPPAAQQPPPTESHLQRWQRAAQDPLLGHHAELGGQQPLHWSLSGATAAQQQAPTQQPVSLQQGLQGLQQLAAYSGWESQADQQLQSHHQGQAQDLMRAMADFTKQQRQQQLADLAAAQGPQQSGGPLLPHRGGRQRPQEHPPPQGNSPTAGAPGQHWRAWAELAQGAAGLDSALGSVSGAPQASMTPAGGWMGTSGSVLQGHPIYCQAAAAAPLHLPANNAFRPFEAGQEGLGMGGIGGSGATGAAGQPDTWLSRRSAPGEAGGLSADVPFQQPAGLGIGLSDPGFGLGGQTSTELRHAAGSLDGLLASWQQLPQAIASQDPVPDSPAS